MTKDKAAQVLDVVNSGKRKKKFDVFRDVQSKIMLLVFKLPFTFES